MAYSTIGERIRTVREFMGWTQQQVADWGGLPNKTTISHYESGRRIPDPHSLKKLATGMRVSTDYLVGLQDRPN